MLRVQCVFSPLLYLCFKRFRSFNSKLSKKWMNLLLQIFTLILQRQQQNLKIQLKKVDNVMNRLLGYSKLFSCGLITVDSECVVFLLVLAQCAVKTCFPVEILPRCPKTSIEHHLYLGYYHILPTPFGCSVWHNQTQTHTHTPWNHGSVMEENSLK